MWPPHIEQIFIDIVVDEQQKGNMEHGVFKAKAWLSITKTLNEQIGKSFLPKQRKWGQLLRHIGLRWDETTQMATASEEVWANVVALGDDNCYMEGITQDDPPVDEQTQRADKRPMEEPTTKGKKVARKVDRASEMTMALQECTTLARERFSNKKGKSSGSSDHVAESAGGGEPCSLRRALEVLN
ncbi:hypothetical protein ACB092_06G087300 [Castanea dentata]